MPKLNAGLKNHLLSQRGIDAIGYVGMGAADSRFSSWVTTTTLENDNLSNLSAFYGVSPQDICAANGIPWSSDAINQWVMSKGGKALPHQAGQPIVAGTPDGGWAVFRNGNKILLPNKVRPGVSPVTVSTKPIRLTIQSSTETNWAFWGVVALSAVAVAANAFSNRGK